ncbi:nuclear receptor corepressor 2 isoform X7, partial [Tachysurus ichikawai]
MFTHLVLVLAPSVCRLGLNLFVCSDGVDLTSHSDKPRAFSPLADVKKDPGPDHMRAMGLCRPVMSSYQLSPRDMAKLSHEQLLHYNSSLPQQERLPGMRPLHIPDPPPLISSAKPGGSITQGTPVQMHSPAHGSEHGKMTPGALPLSWMEQRKLAGFPMVKQEQLSPRGPTSSQAENLSTHTIAHESLSARGPMQAVQGGSITKGLPGTLIHQESSITYRGGSITQGTPADLLYKGTITRLVAEDSPSRDRSRDENQTKGHILYEGTSGHVLSYDRGLKPKEEGKGEMLGLKRPYDIMEGGGISRALPLSAAEGLMGRAMPQERESPRPHHIRGSISQ